MYANTKAQSVVVARETKTLIGHAARETKLHAHAAVCVAGEVFTDLRAAWYGFRSLRASRKTYAEVAMVRALANG